MARGKARKTTAKAPVPVPDPATGPVPYEAFSRYVRQFKTRQLLRLIAEHQLLQWNENAPVGEYSLKPHAGSLIAFEAMASWGAQNQVAPTVDALLRMDGMVIGLQDPILTSPVFGATDDYMVRVSYQQFPYQHPPFNPTARMRPMFERSYPAPRFKVLDTSLIDTLLGTDVETFTGLAPFFLAAVMTNKGTFQPTWFEQDNFASLNEALPPENAIHVFDLMRQDPGYFRNAARNSRSDALEQRQYDFNPFAAKPFVTLPEGFGLAPQPAYVVARFSPSTVFYGGSDHFGQDNKTKNDFFQELGYVNEDYVLLQLKQLERIGATVEGEAQYAKGSDSVDASVVLGENLMLMEVKSTRPVFSARGNADDYREHLDRDIGKAFEQLERTHAEYLAGKLPHLPTGSTVWGFVVTPEQFYMANWTTIRQNLPKVPFPVAIMSFTELEELVSGTLKEGALTAFLHAATNPGTGAMDADPMAAIQAIRQRNGGVTPRNPVLDESFATELWDKIQDSDKDGE